MAKKFYIKERHNPQLGTYYTACGQMTAKEAKSYVPSLYGHNFMHSYDSDEEYQEAIRKLKAEGHEVDSF